MEIWMDVDATLAEVPINLMPILDDTDFKSREESLTYDQAGLDLVWNFITTAGAMSQTSVTPTTGGGDYDWTNQGNGMYSIKIPASGGASINNNAEGFGWFTGYATGVLPWRGPVIGFRAAGLNDKLIDSAYSATRGLAGTALPDAAADAAGGLPISDTGGQDIDTLVSNVAAILVDTGTTLDGKIDTIDANVDSILEDTGTTIPGTITTLDGKVDVVDANVDLILEDTGTTLPATLSTIEGKVDTVDTVADAILVDTGTDIPSSIADIPTVAEFEARTLPSADYFDPSSDEVDADVVKIGGSSQSATDLKDFADTGYDPVTHKVQGVVTVDTTTTNTDMVSSPLDAAGVRSAVGLASANLDTQLGDIPTVSEFNARTLAAADYFDPTTDEVAIANLKKINDQTVTGDGTVGNKFNVT